MSISCCSFSTCLERLSAHLVLFLLTPFPLWLNLQRSVHHLVIERWTAEDLCSFSVQQLSLSSQSFVLPLPSLFDLQTFFRFPQCQGIQPFLQKVRVMMSPTCEWLRFVQEQHGYRFSRRSGLLCCPSFLPLLSLALPVKLSKLPPLSREGKWTGDVSSPALSLLFYTRLLFNLLPQWLTDSLTTGRLLGVHLSSQ